MAEVACDTSVTITMAANSDEVRLPTELIQEICKDLDFYDLVRCLGVNKSWRAAIFGSRMLARKLWLPFKPEGVPFPVIAKQKVKPPPFSCRPPMRIAMKWVDKRWETEPETVQSEMWRAMNTFRLLLRFPVLSDDSFEKDWDGLHPLIRSTLLGYVENENTNYCTVTLSCMFMRYINKEQPRDSLWRDMYVTWPPVHELKLGVTVPGKVFWSPKSIKRESGITLGDVMDEIYLSTLPELLDMGYWDGHRCWTRQEWSTWRNEHCPVLYRMREKVEVCTWTALHRAGIWMRPDTVQTAAEEGHFALYTMHREPARHIVKRLGHKLAAKFKKSN